jgi:MFS family permease
MGKQNVLTEIRSARVERILNSPQNALLTSRTMRRALCIIAVVSSYAYLAALLIPYAPNGGEHLQLKAHEFLAFNYWLLSVRSFIFAGAPLLMAASFLMLRTSMRRVTSLPDEYLDERQIANRDWAFKLGYLVVRRIGLGLTFFFITLQFGTVYGTQIFFDRNWILWKLLGKFNTYLQVLTETNSIGFYLGVLGLLTFVAYSFPLILLAWRESKFPEKMPVIDGMAILDHASKVTARYYRRLSYVVIGIFGYVLLMASGSMGNAVGHFVIYSGILFFVLFGLAPAALLLYIWASFKTVEVLGAAKVNNYNNGENAFAAMFTMTFFVITQLLGISLVVVMASVFSGVSGNGNGLGIAILLGLAMIPAQAASFIFIPKLGKTGKSETN